MTRLAWLRWAPLVTVLVAVPGHAQYKVIGTDGKTTYTDRQPPTAAGKSSMLGPRGAVLAAETALPLEVRQAAARYPVTLYVIASACDPCGTARQLLRQRGIPFSEKLVVSPEDSDALERLSGGRDAPTLSIGAQILRGLAPEVWGSYLDAAGYPRESRLPANYIYPLATPLVDRREASSTLSAPSRDSLPATDLRVRTPAPNPANPSGIKF